MVGGQNKLAHPSSHHKLLGYIGTGRVKQVTSDSYAGGRQLSRISYSGGRGPKKTQEAGFMEAAKVKGPKKKKIVSSKPFPNHASISRNHFWPGSYHVP